MTGETGWIYIIHLHAPLGTTGRNAATHYTGWAASRSLAARLAHHRTGTSGAAMMAAVCAAGITWHVGGLQRGTRADERRLKRGGHHDRRCWTCRAAA